MVGRKTAGLEQKSSKIVLQGRPFFCALSSNTSLGKSDLPENGDSVGLDRKPCVSLTLILAIQAINLTRRSAGVSVKLPVKMNFGHRPIFSGMRERQLQAKERDIE